MAVYDDVFKYADPIIKAFREDLEKYDRELLECPENQKIPFLHFTGENGTQLVLMPSADHHSWPAPGQKIPYLFGTADRQHILSDKQVSVGCMENHGRDELMLYFDGLHLKKVDANKAKQIVASYRHDVERKWRASH